MTDSHILKAIYAFYKKISVSDISHEDEKTSLLQEILREAVSGENQSDVNSQIDSKHILILYNSHRRVPIDWMMEAVNNITEIMGITNFKAISLDVTNKHIAPSEIRVLTLKLLLKSPYQSIVTALRYGPATAVVKCVDKWLSDNAISLVYFFTANSRIVELYRICGIKNRIPCVEFLHGICSDAFAEYYEVLETYSLRKRVKNQYVNMFPGMPLPKIVERNVLYHHDQQIVFKNEEPWQSSKEVLYDVIIVGHLYYQEVEEMAVKELADTGLKIAYCAHPDKLYELGESLRHRVDTVRFPEVINSARVVVGSNSAAVYTAQLSGKEVLVFPEAWPAIPSFLMKIFSDPFLHTYSVKRVLEIINGAGNAKQVIGFGDSVDARNM
jgi:hypothetical protein